MITVILPISRTNYLRPVFNCLAELEKPSDTELLIITDGDRNLERAVDRRLDSVSFKCIQVVSFGDTPAEDIDSRRWRISAIHNKAKRYVPSYCDAVFCVEDDTTYASDVLTKMAKTFEDHNDCAFVQGVELGRRITPYIGAWKTDNVHDPQEIRSVMPSHGLQSIDAGGLYCALIDADIYRNHHFEPLDKGGTNGLSCDVNLGLSIRRRGLTCFIDHSIQCDHIGDKGSVNLGNTKPVQVVFEKVKDKWLGRTI